MSKSPFIEVKSKNSLASTGKSIVRTTFSYFCKAGICIQKVTCTSWQYDLSKRFQVFFWIRTLLCMKILKLCILVRDFSNNLCCMSNRLNKICNLQHNALLPEEVLTIIGGFERQWVWNLCLKSTVRGVGKTICRYCSYSGQWIHYPSVSRYSDTFGYLTNEQNPPKCYGYITWILGFKYWDNSMLGFGNLDLYTWIWILGFEYLDLDTWISTIQYLGMDSWISQLF